MNLLFIISILVIVAGFAFAGKGFRNLEVLFTFHQLNVEDIGKAQPGFADVSGEVSLAQDELTAPFSGETCVLFGIVVEEKHQQGDGPLWEISTTAQHGVPFYLEDDTGSILVDPEGIELDIPENDVLEVPGGVVPPDPIRSTGERLIDERPDWVEGFEVNQMTCLTSRDTRFYEFYVEPGEELHVFGSVMRREEGRNVFYDDEDTYVIFQTDSTPEFALSNTPQGEEVKANVTVTPWMVTSAVFLIGGMLVMGASLA